MEAATDSAVAARDTYPLPSVLPACDLADELDEFDARVAPAFESAAFEGFATIGAPFFSIEGKDRCTDLTMNPVFRKAYEGLRVDVSSYRHTRTLICPKSLARRIDRGLRL